MTARFRTRVIAAAAVASACTFSAPVDQATGDAGPDAPVLPDAGPCQSVGEAMCLGDVLRACTVMNEPPIDTPCGWGCVAAPDPHCAKLQPSGGAVVESDLLPDPGLMPVTLLTDGSIVFNTDTGEITGRRGPGTGVIDDIGFATANGVGIFRFQSLAIEGTQVAFRGTNAVALVSVEGMDLKAVLDVRGTCTGSAAGPGGRPGGAAATAASGSGAGAGGASDSGNVSSGGGGGAYGGDGGDGGNPNGVTTPAGGNAFGTAEIALLRGGAGGGGGGGPSGGVGGGGGGAIQLAANGPVTFTGVAFLFYPGINAGGCNGKNGTSDDAGGGGGAGGAILIEAPSVTLDAGGLAVNGGGGGAQNGVTAAQSGRLVPFAAAGGRAPQGQNGDGGDGAAGETLDGADGEDADDSGGGGGGVGWIRINTRDGSVALPNTGFVSPSFTAGDTTASRAPATVQ